MDYALTMSTHIQDLIGFRISRRSVLRGAAATLVGTRPFGGSAAAKAVDGFEELRQGQDDQVHWPYGTHSMDLVVSWGDPLWSDVPRWEGGQTTAAAQARQFGDCNDFIAFSPLPRGSGGSVHGLLTVNHEFTQAATMFVGHDDPKAPERVAAEMNGHGMSVVEVKLSSAGWAIVKDGKFNRRITLHTPMSLTGPVAGHERVKTEADPTGRTVAGTLANCGGGTTPWGTVLSGEENVNFYWNGSVDGEGLRQAGHRAMGIGEHQYWHFSVVDPRFDLALSPTEPNRFGWVVEIDPYRPESVPKKRTALGRFFHEGAELVVDISGHVVVYMGDDSPDEHLYRFVSKGRFVAGESAANEALLAEGVLSVAVFSDQGLRWAPLKHEGVLAEHFESLADILIDTRIAAKLVGATAMDRPERVAAHPTNGKIYVMLTQNPDRKKSGPGNPRENNLWGQILEISPGVGGHTQETMAWTVMLEGGPRGVATTAPAPPSTSKDGLLACPDNAIFDSSGRLWVCTDGNERLNSDGPKSADALYVVDTEGPMRGRSRLFLRACAGAELTGPCFTPDGQTLFVSVQHPGYMGPYEYSGVWPQGEGTGPPRSTVVALRRKAGGPIL